MNFFKPQIQDYDLLQGYFSACGENSCQHSFVNMFTLYEKYGAQYCVQDDFLYILRSHICTEDFRTYLFPMGSGDTKKAVENIIEDAHAHNTKVCFNTITEEKCKWLMEAFPDVFVAEEFRAYAEYIYLTENLIELPGKKFKNKRLEANSVRRLYEGRMEKVILTKEHTDEILGFEEKWIENSLGHDAEALYLEYREMKKQLEYFDELKLAGMLVRIDGRMEGFVYGAPISDECFDLLVEKGNRDIKHICRALEQDAVRLCASQYKYINREEDVGVWGLRQSKLSYRPDILLNKYIAKEK